jgi:hypothetical protein
MFGISFGPPRELRAAHFRLEPLGPQHNERDHPAWMSSIDHIHSTPGFTAADWAGDAWPFAMSRDDNLADLVKHAEEFESGEAFAYTVLDPETDDVIGCAYVDPDDTGAADAMCRCWVRASHSNLDGPLYVALVRWFEGPQWPFTTVRFPGRVSAGELS